MRMGALVVLMSVAVSCGGPGGFFRQYEYEEDLYLALDGSATLYVNSSIPALNALRGTAFDERPEAPVDLSAVRDYFSTSATRVERVTSTSRRNRRFVHLRLAIDDVRRLSDAEPFAWSSYGFDHDGSLVRFRQAVGPAARADAGPVEWAGDEIVAFRLHLPSRIVFHNSPLGEQRGNILAWEQPLTDRLGGEPVSIEVRMELESILYRTLVLFGGTMAAVAAMFAGIIWWVVRRGRQLEARG